MDRPSRRVRASGYTRTMANLVQSLDLSQIIDNLSLLAAAYVLALPIAVEREKFSRSAGLRTFPLVAMASAGFVLMALPFTAGNPDAQSRLVQGLMAGIGFIGGGAILKDGPIVRGTATATAIWSTAAVGASVAFRRIEIGIAISLVTFLTFQLMPPVKEEIETEPREADEMESTDESGATDETPTADD